MRSVDPATDVHVDNGLVVLQLLPLLFPVFGIIGSLRGPYLRFIQSRNDGVCRLACCRSLDMASRIAREQEHLLVARPHYRRIGESARDALIIVRARFTLSTARIALLVCLSKLVGRFEISS
jgi:hypothetical protein